MKKIGKIITYCSIGLLALNYNTMKVKAEIPIAGINLVLNEFYESEPSKYDLSNYLPPESEQLKLAFAHVTDYVNIRSKPSEESEILGKLFNNSAATIIDYTDGWVKVKSGSVTGYIKKDYLLTGSKAEELAKTVGTRIAKVTTTTLKVREKSDMDSPVITLVPIGDEFQVKKELNNGWVKILYNDNKAGFVSKDFVELKTEYEEAISIEEEQARLEAEEEARQAILEAQSENNVNDSRDSRSSSRQSTTVSKPESNISTPSSGSLRDRIVNYALRFQGNPYVWGGTSLTNGTDCSGFTQSVFRDNGISISRTSRTQAVGGRSISISNMQAGDLVFYERNGRINHVGIYIGNGRVISASSPETGIRITNYNYRTPCKVVSYIN
jgi:cell wall-associated NlpC family hydrolase